MIIGIDGNEANVEKRLGVGEIAYQLMLKFSVFVRQSTDQFSKHKFIVYLKDKPLEDLPQVNEKWDYRVIKPGKMWTQWRLPLDLYLHKPRPDVFFTPTHYAPRFSPVPTVISIMDLAYVYFPELFKQRDLYKLENWTRYSALNARKIIAISKSTKDDIIKEYNVEPEKIDVVYPGIKQKNMKSPHGNKRIPLFDKYRISQNFILFVGTLQPRKNIVSLIEAFKKAVSIKGQVLSIKDLDLVIIGKKGWMYEEILKRPGELAIEDRVKFLDFVPDEDLGFFYENAICYVLPSLYEGFGLPVLEAMSYGCPVITSNISSLPEAGGDAALYADPKNPGDIADKIVSLINDNNLRKELIQKGYKQVNKFSWEKSARETLRVLEEAAGK